MGDFSDKATSTCSEQVSSMKRIFSTEKREAGDPKIDERYSELIKFVQRCLKAKPKERFGDFETAKDHPFLKGIDWPLLLAEDGHTVPGHTEHKARQIGIDVFRLA